MHLLIPVPSTGFTTRIYVEFIQKRDNSTLTYRHVLVKDIYTGDLYSCKNPEGDHTAHSTRETHFGRRFFFICLNIVKSHCVTDYHVLVNL